MKIFKQDAFKVSRSGQATQVLLLCHGGWDSNDGFTFVPKGTMIHYYCGHSHFGIGAKVAKAVLENQADSVGGLTTAYQPKPRPAGVSDTAWDAFVAGDKAAFMGGQGRVAVVDSVGNQTQLMQIHNYALGRYGPDDKIRAEEEVLWNEHSTGQFGPDVDLIVMKRDTKRHSMGYTRMRHLSEAIEVTRQANGGQYYSVFHYAPCRHVQGDGIVQPN